MNVKKSYFLLKQLPLTEGITVLDILLEVQTNKCPSKANPACQIYIFFPWNHIFNTLEENGKVGVKRRVALKTQKRGHEKIFLPVRKKRRGIKLAIWVSCQNKKHSLPLQVEFHPTFQPCLLFRYGKSNYVIRSFWPSFELLFYMVVETQYWL